MLTGECRRRPRRTPWSRAIARGWLVVGLLVVGTPALLAAHPALRRAGAGSLWSWRWSPSSLPFGLGVEPVGEAT